MTESPYGHSNQELLLTALIHLVPKRILEVESAYEEFFVNVILDSILSGSYNFLDTHFIHSTV